MCPRFLSIGEVSYILICPRCVRDSCLLEMSLIFSSVQDVSEILVCQRCLWYSHLSKMCTKCWSVRDVCLCYFDLSKMSPRCWFVRDVYDILICRRYLRRTLCVPNVPIFCSVLLAVSLMSILLGPSSLWYSVVRLRHTSDRLILQLYLVVLWRESPAPCSGPN